MAVETGLNIIIKAVDKASGPLRRISARLGTTAAGWRGAMVGAGRAVIATVGDLILKLAKLSAAIVAVGAVATEEIARRSVNAAASFEYSITRAATMTGKTGEALKATVTQLSAFGVAMAKISMKKPEEIAQSFYDLMSAGLNVQELMQTFPVALALAEGAGSDLHTSTELLTATTRAFGLEMSEANRVGNVLAATLSNTRGTVERLSAAMPYVATAAKQVGLDVEHTSAALGVLMDRGLEASMAGTGLRQVFAQLSKPTDEAQAVLSKYGLTLSAVTQTEEQSVETAEKLAAGTKTVTKAYDAWQSKLEDHNLRMVQASRRITQTIPQQIALKHSLQSVERAQESYNDSLAALQKLTPEVRQGLINIDPARLGLVGTMKKLRDMHMSYSDVLSVFGIRAGNAAKILMDNTAAWDELTGKVSGTNRAFELQEGLMDTVSAQWEAFKGDIKMVLTTIGQQLLPVVREMLGPLREFMGWLVQSGVAKQYGEALAILARSFIVLVTSLVKSGEIKTFFQNAVNAVYDFATVIRELASGEMIQGFIEQIRAMVQELMETFRGEGFVAMLAQMGQMIWTTFVRIFNAIGTYINAWLTYYFGENWTMIANTLSGIWKALGQVFTKEFAAKLVAAAEAILPHIVAIVQWFAAWIAKYPEWAAGIAIAALFADKLLAVGMVLWKVVAGVNWLVGLLTGGSGLGVALTATSALIASIVVATAAAFLLWKRNFDQLVGATDAYRQSLDTTVQSVKMAAQLAQRRGAGAEFAQQMTQVQAATPTIGERFAGMLAGRGVTGRGLAQQRVFAGQAAPGYGRQEVHVHVAGSIYGDRALEEKIRQGAGRLARSAGY